MSGPYAFNVTVISGQKDSSVAVIAASAFLYRGWMSIYPIATNKDIKQEVFSCLSIFHQRGCFDHAPEISKAKDFAERIDTPFSVNSVSGSLFWIALDEQGYAIAKNLLSKGGIIPNQKVYKSVCKLNLIEQPMPPYPDAPVSSPFWNEVPYQFFLINRQHEDVKSDEGRQALYAQYAPMTPTEQEFYSWYKLLHDNLMPWRETIGNIQSDWS